MINIFDIKKQKKNLVKNTEEGIQEYKRESIKENEEILKEYKTTEKGLSFREAQKRIEENGENIVVKEDKRGWLYFFFNSFKDQFIIILLFLAIINFSLGDKLGSAIIVIIAFISAFIRFVQDYSVYKFNNLEL